MSNLKWAETVELCKNILSNRPFFDQNERDFKLTVAERVRAAVAASKEGRDFLPLLKRAFGSGNNLTDFRAHAHFLDWAASNPELCHQALDTLGGEDLSVEDKVDGFLTPIPREVLGGTGTRLSIASFLLMGLDPQTYVMFRSTAFETAECVLGWPQAPEELSEGQVYAHHLDFAHHVFERLRAADVAVRDILDVQGLIWILTKWEEPQYQAWRANTPINTRLQQAMDEYERDADSDDLERQRALFEEARSRFEDIFGSYEAIQSLTAEQFSNFFNSLDTHGGNTTGLFTFNLPIPRNPATRSYRGLEEDLPALKHALTELLHGEGTLAERIDRILAGPRVRLYITPSLPIPSALLCFHDPNRHAGVQQMKFKEAKLRAAGAHPQLPPEATIGERFEAYEEALARLPSSQGREWDWVQRFGFYWSDAFRRNLESPPDPLADLVAHFREEQHYPNEQSRQEMEARAEFAEYLSEDALTAPDWNKIKLIVSTDKYGSLGPHSGLNQYINDADEEGLEKLQRTIEHLLYSEGSLAERLGDVLDGEYTVPGFDEAAATKLLSIRHPEKVIPVFVYGGRRGKAKLMEAPVLGLKMPATASRAKLAACSNDLLRARLEPYFDEDTWGMSRFLYWLADRLAKQTPITERNGESTKLRRLASDLLVDEEFLREAVSLLRDKGQLILYGPPGTGKTYLARALLRLLAPDEARHEVVQFHPSYSYEDFVQGYRPITSADGSLSYEIKPGPLMRMSTLARELPDFEHVLLIDEINRGNLPKILGELLYLLEYRNDEVALMYGEDGLRFSLPKKLLIIGTMNTADRSIALVDSALRRRFHFIPLFPGQHPLQGILRRWLEQNVPKMSYVADIVDHLNAKLRERFGPHLQLGHSYFMRGDLSEVVLQRIWLYDVMPFLEEQLFGHDEELREFKLDRLLEADNDAHDHADGAQAGPAHPIRE